MLTRRDFATLVSCAICAVSEFAASEVLAQGTPAATTPGVTRKILSQIDGPTPGYVTISFEAEIEPGVTVARHSHPGIESAYILEGGFELPIEGQPTRMMKAGDAVVIAPNTPHAGGKNGDNKPGSRVPTSWRRASRWPRPPDPKCDAVWLTRSRCCPTPTLPRMRGRGSAPSARHMGMRTSNPLHACGHHSVIRQVSDRGKFQSLRGVS
jgi:quercetin dioxygenase-like cupin family protein